METTTEKINIRGSINGLEPGTKLTLSRKIYKPSTVRSSAVQLKTDTGKVFTVTVTHNLIIVTRLS